MRSISIAAWSAAVRRGDLGVGLGLVDLLVGRDLARQQIPGRARSQEYEQVDQAEADAKIAAANPPSGTRRRSKTDRIRLGYTEGASADRWPRGRGTG